MADRGRQLNSNRSDRDSTSDREDSPSRSNSTNPSSEHPARRESLRFTSIDPMTWGQRSHRPQETLEMNDATISKQREDVINQTFEMPFDEQRAMWQQWIDTIDERYRVQETYTMHYTIMMREVDHTVGQTQGMTVTEQRPIWIQLRDNLDDSVKERARRSINEILIYRRQMEEMHDIYQQIAHENQDVPHRQQVHPESLTDRPDGASTSNRDDSPSRSDSINPSSEHIVNVVPFRFTNIEPLIREQEQISHGPQEAYEITIRRQREDIMAQTYGKPFNEQLDIWRQWIGSLDERDRPRETSTMHYTIMVREVDHTIGQTRGMTVTEQRPIWRQLVDNLDESVKPKARDEINEILRYRQQMEEMNDIYQQIAHENQDAEPQQIEHNMSILMDRLMSSLKNRTGNECKLEYKRRNRLR